MEPQRFKLTKAANLLGVNPWTLRRWVYAGRVPFIKSETGRVFIPAWWVEEQVGTSPPSKDIRCAIYVRESSSENKAAMESQLSGLLEYAKAKGYQVLYTVKEFGSGVNDNRPKLHTLLSKKDFDVLIIEHKDRLTRFGFNFFEKLCPFKIEVVNIAQNRTNDLMEDLVAILTSFSARLYGQRRGRKKTKAAVKALQET